ncbi:MAG: hypothetical protein RL113_606 [Pseudomonadota bacterium]|jgi:hypothetical protein
MVCTTLIFFSGCEQQGPASEHDYYYSGIYFGKYFTPFYKKGIRDGCTTSKGQYRKSHKLFQSNTDYNQGWFLGRNRCKDLLVTEEDKKKI